MDVQERVDKLKSQNPVERIEARIGLLRDFPERGDQEVKSQLHTKLTEDVMGNRPQTVDYVLGQEDLPYLAYSAMAVDYGLTVNKRKVPPSVRDQQRERRRFISGIEVITDRLEEVQDEQSRLEVAEIIAQEGSLSHALVALQKTFEMGWNTRVQELFFTVGGMWAHKYLKDSLAETIRLARQKKVKYKALKMLSDFPEERERNEILEGFVTSDDPSIALKAAELYLQKVEGSQGKASVALDIIVARKKDGLGNVTGVANQAAVEWAFNRYIELKKPEERIKAVASFLDNFFQAWIARREQAFPQGLIGRAHSYLVDHLDEVRDLEPESERDKVLMAIAERANNENELKAIDFLAQTRNPMRGVETIAQLYVNRFKLYPMGGEDTRRRVTEWAIRFTRKFADLADKELAATVLLGIGGEEPEKGGDLRYFEGDRAFTDGIGHIERETGKGYDAIARDELKKLPKPKIQQTEEERLAEVFSLNKPPSQ